MSQTITAPVKRTRKLKRDKPLTEEEEKLVTEFDKSRVHIFTEESVGKIPEGGICDNAVSYCGLTMKVQITRKASIPGNVCPICHSLWAEKHGIALT
jgi:hypothetical protein